MKNADFFSRLYAGFEAEHFVTGKLFGAGLEAFKLPADFGFDLLVSNQKETSMGGATLIERVFPFPYALQVKSRRVREEDSRPGPNGRPEAFVHFRLSMAEYELLSSEARSYLVCVAFPPVKSNTLASQALCFWLKGSQLPELKRRGYLDEVCDEGRRQFDLMVSFRSLPTVSRDAVLNRMCKQGEITEKALKALTDLLPPNIQKKRGTEYVALHRHPWSMAKMDFYSDRNVAKKLNTAHLDLSFIGSEVCFPTSDAMEPNRILSERSI